MATTPCINGCLGWVDPWGRRGSGFVSCRYCGVVFRHPMPSSAALDAYYRSVYAANGAAMTANGRAMAAHARLVQTLAPPGSRVLDFGAGTGGLSRRLAAAGFDVEGVEPSPGARRAALDRNGLALFPDLGFVRGPYSLIVAMEVVEHLSDPLNTLGHLRDLLRPGGKLYVTTPNARGLLARLGKDRWREAQKPGHLVLFSRQALAATLEDAGFASVRFVRFSPLDGPGLVRTIVQRGLQLAGLFGGLRVVAEVP